MEGEAKVGRRSPPLERQVRGAATCRRDPHASDPRRTAWKPSPGRGRAGVDRVQRAGQRDLFREGLRNARPPPGEGPSGGPGSAARIQSACKPRRELRSPLRIYLSSWMSCVFGFETR